MIMNDDSIIIRPVINVVNDDDDDNGDGDDDDCDGDAHQEGQTKDQLVSNPKLTDSSWVCLF